MIYSFEPAWNPTLIRRVEECRDTGSEVVEVVTNQGRAFAKFLGNREGPHVLACETLGTNLAELFGLPTFERAVFDYDGFPEVELYSRGVAQAGPAWISRLEEGITWSGRKEDLNLISNKADLAKLVILDTWILNCDRYDPRTRRVNRNNVFFSRKDPGVLPFRLMAMDHTHSFTCGRPLGARLSSIEYIKNDTILGLFPEFKEVITYADLVAAQNALGKIPTGEIEHAVDDLPDEWEIDNSIRTTLKTFLNQRRDYVIEDLSTRIIDQPELDLE